MLLVPKIYGRIWIIGKDRLQQTGHNSFGLCREKNLGYFVIVEDMKKCTILVAHGRRTYVFHFDEEKANLCEVINMEKVRLLSKCVFFGHGNVQHGVVYGNRITGHGIICI